MNKMNDFIKQYSFNLFYRLTKKKDFCYKKH
jgi:hypothetical protein